METGIQWLIDRFDGFGEAEAIVSGRTVWTYSHLVSIIHQRSRSFQKMGVRQGHLVILETPDYSPEAVAALWAFWNLGAIVLPLTDAQPMRRDVCVRILKQGWICRIGKDLVDGQTDCISVLPFGNETQTNDLIGKLQILGHPGLILITSGTTAEPKAALHDLTNLLEKFRKPRQPARTLGFLMFDHMGGIDTMAYAMASGGTLVLLPSLKRDPEQVAATMAESGVELLPTSPTFLNHLLLSDCLDRFDLSSLKRISYGTEPMPGFVLEKLRQKMPDVILNQSYGTTELGVPGVKTMPESAEWIAIGGSGIETRIVDQELLVRSPAAMLGYLNAPCPFDSEGWYATGDLVELDPSGNYYRILGRKTDIINVGGEKVAPAEVENVLMQAPNISDVQVTSKPNPLIGSMIIARVVVNEPEKSADLAKRLRDFCLDRLAPYQIPMKFEIVEHLNRTSRGKIRRIEP